MRRLSNTRRFYLLIINSVNTYRQFTFLNWRPASVTSYVTILYRMHYKHQTLTRIVCILTQISCRLKRFSIFLNNVSSVRFLNKEKHRSAKRQQLLTNLYRTFSALLLFQQASDYSQKYRSRNKQSHNRCYGFICFHPDYNFSKNTFK